LDASGSRLFVAQDNADQVAVIRTVDDTVVAKIDARAPAGVLPDASSAQCDAAHPDGSRLTGVGTFSATLAPDGKTLYAVNAGANSIAVIPLHGPGAYRVS